MKSRIGYKPNGVLQLKEPGKHFQEAEFVKAIDKWSVSMKDNPLPHFAAKIKIKQVNVFPYFGVASTRKYEDRSTRTEREYANPDKYNRMPQIAWNSVNVWNYNLGEKDKNFSVILEDTVYSQGCTGCSESGSIVVNCSSCSGRGHVWETDYSNNSRRSVSCGSCLGSGRDEEQCRTCKGHGGFVNYVVCDVEYSYPNVKEFYCDESVEDILDTLDFEKAEFEMFAEVTTAAELVNFVQGEIKEEVTADIISFVQSHDKEHQHFLGEKTQYGQAYFSLVRFEYENGREYTVAVYGDKDVIYAPESPISQSAEKILDEANDLLVAHDFKAAAPVLQMIQNMGLRRNILNEIVERFQTNLSLAHAHNATDLKSDLQKADSRFHSKILGNKNIKDGEMYPFLTELGTLVAVPFIASLGLKILQLGSLDMTALTDFSVTALLMTTLSFATFYIYSRKKDVGFKKIWKYLILSIAFGYIAFDTTGMMKHDPILVVAPINILVALVCSWLAGLLNDHKVELPTEQGSAKYDKLLALYKDKLSALKKYFPRDEFSYIDDEKKKDYQIASRELDETLRNTSEDDAMNLIEQEDLVKAA